MPSCFPKGLGAVGCTSRTCLCPCCCLNAARAEGAPVGRHGGQSPQVKPAMSTSACLHDCSACQAHLLHIHSRGATLPEVHAALLHAQHAQGALPVGRRLAEVDLGRLGQLAGEDKGLLQGSTLGPSALQDDAQVCRAKLQSLSTCCLVGFAAPEGVEANMQMAPDALKSALQTAGGQAQTVCSPTI